MKFNKITVAIVTRNRANSLKRCLKSLVKQSKKPKEILVIDNASIDTTKNVVKKFYRLLPIKYFFEPEIGIPTARNRAIKEAKGEILAFIDDDCVASKNWVEEIQRAHSQHPLTLAIQGQSESLPQKSIYARIWSKKYFNWIKKNIYGEKHLFIIDTKNVSFKLKTIKKYSIYFDTFFERGSDVALAKKILSLNQKIIFNKDILVYHYERSTLREFLKQQFKSGQTRAQLESFFPQFNSIEKSEKGLFVTTDLSLSEKSMYWFVIQVSNLGYHLRFNKSQKPDQKIEISLSNKKTKKISVGIVTFDRANLLYKCLESLARQSIIPKEIIIVHRPSSDGTEAVVERFKKLLPIEYVVEQKQGVGVARNRAIKEAKGEILAFIDDDCEAQENWIEEILKAHRKYPRAIAIQGSAEALNINSSFGLLAHIYKNDWINQHVKEDGSIKILDTLNASFKLNLFKKKNFYFNNHVSERFYYGDDLDIAQQITNSGESIIFNQNIRVKFFSKIGFVDFLKQRYQLGRLNSFLNTRWPELFESKQKTILINPNPRSPFRNGLIASKIYYLNLLAKRFFNLGQIIEFLNYYDFKNKLLPAPLKRINNFSLKRFKLSVMLITKDRPQTLKRTLESLVRQTVSPWEIVIVDASLEKNNKLIRHYQRKFKIKYLHTNKVGYAIQRNLALQLIRGDIVATIDDDSEASNNWCESILKAHQKHKDATAILGRIISRPESSLIAQLEQMQIDNWIIKNLSFDQTISILTTKNASFKMSKIKELDLSFSNHPLHDKYNGEDVDFGLRIQNKEGIIKYEPTVLLYHWERESLVSFLKQYFRKGRSGALNDYEWRVNKLSPFFIIPPYLRFWLEILMHPLSKKNPLKVPLYLILKYTILLSHNIGRWVMIRHLEKINFPYDLIGRSSAAKANFIDIGIITRNRDKKLEKLLSSLTLQSVYPNSIIIVDNGSSDNTVEVIQKYKKFLPIKTLYFQEKSIPRSRNLILNSSSAQYLTFIDDDCTVTKNWLSTLVVGHIRYPDAFALQGKSISMPRGNIYSIITQFYRERFYGANILTRKKYEVDNLDPDQESPKIGIADTRNVSLHLAKIKSSGLSFDESLFRGSDVDFGRAILKKKGVIYYLRHSFVYHWERNTLIEFIIQVFNRARGRVLVLRKNQVDPAGFSFKEFWGVYLYFLRYTSLRRNPRKFGYFISIFLLYNLVYALGTYTQQIICLRRSLKTPYKKYSKFSWQRIAQYIYTG